MEQKLSFFKFNTFHALEVAQKTKFEGATIEKTSF